MSHGRRPETIVAAVTDHIVGSARTGGVRVTSVAVPTTRLLELASDDAAERADVRGAIVKLRPTIRASARASWDGGALAAALRERGAIAVLLAPTVVPDEGRLTEVARAESPVAAIDAWFDALPGVDAEDRDAARMTARVYLSEDRGR